MTTEKTSLEYSFELLRSGDVNECIEVISKTAGGMYVDTEIVKQTLRDPNVITVVAKSQKKIKGIVNGLIPPNFIQPPKIVFIGVVDQESAMKGLPALLIDQFINELKKQFPKIPFIDVNLNSRDTNAVALYSSKGFSVEGFIKSGLGDADVVILRKRFISKETIRTPIA